MERRLDLVVVGMGSAGMTAAEFAARLGRTVAVVERGRVGGDCLWTGCVPSKALIASARVAHHARRAGEFGLPVVDAPIDASAVWRRVRSVQHAIASTDDDPRRYEGLGVEIVAGSARLTSPNDVVVTAADGRSRSLSASTILLCTGSRPAIPDVPGLDDAGYLTSESIFELDEVPGRLVFLGGGPIAVELAQACRRLDIDVTIVQKGPQLLPREEPELVAMLRDTLLSEGVGVHTGVDVTRVEEGQVVGVVDGREHRWAMDAVVVAAGRRPNIEGLGIEEVGVATDEHGIVVDRRMRTTVPSIYAAGDVCGHDLFTHAAAYRAVRALRDAWFPGRGDASALVPWTTFSDPELAHVGLTSSEAVARFGADRVRIHRLSMSHNDRARTDNSTGAMVLIERRRRRGPVLVGAHILAQSAGELAGELCLAIEEELPASRLGGLVHVYPTIATSIQQLGGDAAMESARRFRWAMRLTRRR